LHSRVVDYSLKVIGEEAAIRRERAGLREVPNPNVTDIEGDARLQGNDFVLFEQTSGKRTSDGSATQNSYTNRGHVSP
jgi:hypothetical protein